jgi:hypothetical protein
LAPAVTTGRRGRRLIDAATLAVINAADDIAWWLGLTRADVLDMAEDLSRENGSTVAEALEALGRMIGRARPRSSPTPTATA